MGRYSLLTMSNSSVYRPSRVFQHSVLGMEPSGILETILKPIMKFYVNIHKVLYANTLLPGGTNLFQGIATRMQKENTALACSTMKIKIIALSEYKSRLEAASWPHCLPYCKCGSASRSLC
jgi:actin